MNATGQQSLDSRALLVVPKSFKRATLSGIVSGAFSAHLLERRFAHDAECDGIDTA
jgi:hypothetical protein